MLSICNNHLSDNVENDRFYDFLNFLFGDYSLHYKTGMNGEICKIEI